MNLTSKRMLQFLTVCASMCALSVTAADYVADSFESPDGAVDLPIAQYKQILGAPDGNGVVITNYVWLSQDGDVSKVIAEDNSAFTTAKGRPFATADKSLALNLETEGGTLTRVLDGNATNDFVVGTPVYVDTLIKFTPSEENPTIDDPNVKVAAFVNALSNLVIYTGKNVTINEIGTTDTGLAIDPEQWYRLTIMLGQIDTTPVAQIFLNGSPVETADGMDELGNSGGSWYLSAAGLAPSLSSISFKGTGMIDELVVTDMANGFDTPPAGILLTLAFDDAMVSVTTNGAAAATGAQVPTDTAVVITAQPWYYITDVGSLFIGGDTTNKVSGSEMITGINGTVSTELADQTNTIVAAIYNTNAGLPSGFGGYPIGDIATWAMDNGQDPEDITEAMLDDYLLDVAPGTDATLTITSIVVDDIAGIATVTIQASSELVDLGTINGTLVVYTADALADGFGEPLETDFELTAASGQQATIEVNVGAGKFIKAVVR